MDTQDMLLDPKALKNLAQDLGQENTRKFMESLDNEFQKRIQNIKQAMSDHSLAALSAQAHSLKSSAQVSGAYRLAEALAKLEVVAGQNQDEAFAMAQDVLTLAELTRFAYLDVKLDK